MNPLLLFQVSVGAVCLIAVMLVISLVVLGRMIGYFYQKKQKERKIAGGPSMGFVTFLVRAIFFGSIVYYQLNQILQILLSMQFDVVCQITVVGSSFMYGFTKYWLYTFLFLKQAAVQFMGMGDPLDKKFSEYSRFEQFLFILMQLYLAALFVFLAFAKATLVDGQCVANYVTHPVLKFTSPIVALFEFVLSISYLHLFIKPLKQHVDNLKEQSTMSSAVGLIADYEKVNRLETLLRKNMICCVAAMICTLANITLSILLTSLTTPLIADTQLSGTILIFSASLDLFLNGLATLYCMSREMWTEWAPYIYLSQKFSKCTCVKRSSFVLFAK
jgi:hypothetical protein